MIDLAPAHVGHDAVRAGVIAATHDRDESGDLFIDGRDGVIEFLVRLTPIEKPLRSEAEFLDGLRSNHKIYDRKAVLEIFLRSLGRAPGNHDFPARPLRLPSLEPADFRKRPVFSMLTHRAGVHQENGCLVGILRLDETVRFQVPAHLAGIRDIHLAPIGAHVKLHNRGLYTVAAVYDRRQWAVTDRPYSYASRSDRRLHRSAHISATRNPDCRGRVPLPGGPARVSRSAHHSRPRRRGTARDRPFHAGEASCGDFIPGRSRSWVDVCSPKERGLK